MSDHTLLNAALALVALGVALWLRPWRAVGAGGPPWPWLAVWAAMPLMWGIDRFAGVAVLQPLSLAPLLVLMAGWPLATLAFVPALLVTVLAGNIGWADGVHRLMWLGVAPAVLTLGIGAALRAALPHHLFIYILGRGFFGTFIASVLAGVAGLAMRSPPNGSAEDNLVIARVLNAFGEAFITGGFTAILVAFKPQWLATYSDRLYLPPPPR